VVGGALSEGAFSRMAVSVGAWGAAACGSVGAGLSLADGSSGSAMKDPSHQGNTAGRGAAGESRGARAARDVPRRGCVAFTVERPNPRVNLNPRHRRSVQGIMGRALALSPAGAQWASPG